MINLSSQVTGVDSLVSLLQQLSRPVETFNLRDVMKDVVDRSTKLLKERTPPLEGKEGSPGTSGLTKLSWVGSTFSSDKAIYTEISNVRPLTTRGLTAEQLVNILEGGAKKHDIEPKKEFGWLKFYWEKVGATVFFERIHRHPGTPAYRMVKSSQSEIFYDIFYDTIEKTVRERLNELVGKN